MEFLDGIKSKLNKSDRKTKEEKKREKEQEKLLKDSQEYKELRILKKIFQEANYNGIVFTRNKPKDIYRNIKYNIEKELSDQEIFVYAFGKNIAVDMDDVFDNYKRTHEEHLKILKQKDNLEKEKFEEQIREINFEGWKELISRKIFGSVRNYEVFSNITNITFHDLHENNMVSNNCETVIFKISYNWSKNKAIAICNLLNDENNNRDLESRNLYDLLVDYNPDKYQIIDEEENKSKIEELKNVKDKYFSKIKNIKKK